jgi:hypothetical protein
MRREVYILLSFTLILGVAAPIIAATPTRLGKIILVKSKNKKVQVNREGRWIQVSQGADLFADDLLKPERGATVKINCSTASSTNSDIKRVPAGIPSNVNNLCLQEPPFLGGNVQNQTRSSWPSYRYRRSY